jgi:hypothetical protein
VVKLVSTLAKHEGAVLCVRWSCSDSGWLASGSGISSIFNNTLK